MSAIARIKDAVFDRFRSRAAPGLADVEIYENPTEEIIEEMRSGRGVKLWAQGRKGEQRKRPKRLEENYLYSTRRFPAANDNVIGAGAITAGVYRFFQNQVGAQGNADGFPTGFVLTDLETNMDVGGQIAQGKNFYMRSVGISFNTEAFADNIEQVLDASALVFTKQGVQYSLRHGPARLWPGGVGVGGFSTRTAVETAHNGLNDPRAQRSLRVPRIIREKESFAYQFNVPLAVRSTNGSAWAMSDFVTCTIHLWGSQLDLIPG
jgi:hypothetical protein